MSTTTGVSQGIKPTIRRSTDDSENSLDALVEKLLARLHQGEPRKYRLRENQTPSSSLARIGRAPVRETGQSRALDRNRGRSPSTGRDSNSRDQSRDRSRERSSSRGRSVECYNCHGYGHLAGDCSSTEQFDRQGKPTGKSPNAKGGTLRPHVPPKGKAS